MRAYVSCAPDYKEGAMKKYLLPKEGKFYKANLHCHSDLSDGHFSPEELKNLYKSHGYSVLAYTDHDMFLPHHELSDDSFVALAGFEAAFNENSQYPGNKRLKSCHICCIAGTPDIEYHPAWNAKYAYVGNAKENRHMVRFDTNEPLFEREYTPECISRMIKIAREKGFFVTYNHSAWSMETCEQFTNYENLHAMEIFNNGEECEGYPSYSICAYDAMLRSGKQLFAIAADDNHNKHPLDTAKCDSFGGWIMIKAEALTYTSVTDALFKGNFYASCGPEIHELYIEDNKIYVFCSEAARITINKGVRGAGAVLAECGEAVTEAVFDFEEDDVYFRIEVTDKYGKTANTNAYFL